MSVTWAELVRQLGGDALELAAAGWPVLPCNGKVPVCRGGHLGGSTDLAQVEQWWTEHPDANIGARVPDNMAGIDVDPRNGGHETLAELEERYGPLPVTLTVKTGGHELGRHFYFQRPPGPLSNGSDKLGSGIDVKLGGKGLLILPPSRHPETFRRYE